MEKRNLGFYTKNCIINFDLLQTTHTRRFIINQTTANFYWEMHLDAILGDFIIIPTDETLSVMYSRHVEKHIGAVYGH